MATTTNMGLVLPTVSVTIGPTYATQNNTAFTAIDSHDHTTGNGVQIPTGGININADLEFNDNSATEIKSAVFSEQVSLLTGTRFAQVSGGELYFNDGSGNQVQITNAGALDISSSGGIVGDYTSAGAAVSFNNTTNSYTFVNGSAVSSYLEMKGYENAGKVEENTLAVSGNVTLTDTDDNYILLVDTTAARSITLPDPTLGNRVFVVKDVTGDGNENAITLVRNGAENIEGVAASYVLQRGYGSWRVVSDGTDWFVIGNSWDPGPTYAEILGGSSQSTGNTRSTYTLTSITTSASPLGSWALSTNQINFPTAGTYRVVIEQDSITCDTQNTVGFYLRNDTDAADNYSFLVYQSNDTGSVTNHKNPVRSGIVSIDDPTDDFSIEWVIGSGTVTQNGPGRIHIWRLG